MVYSFPFGKASTEFIKELSDKFRKPKDNDKSSYIVTQNSNDFSSNEYYLKKIRSMPIKMEICAQTMDDINKINDRGRL